MLESPEANLFESIMTKLMADVPEIRYMQPAGYRRI